MSHCKACKGTGVIAGASYGGMTERIACDCECSDECTGHAWEIEPHPYSKDLDIFVCDTDDE